VTTATPGDYGLALTDLSTGEEARRLLVWEDEVTSIAFSPDGKLLAAGSLQGVLRLWEVATGKLLRRWGHLPDGTPTDPQAQLVRGLQYDPRVIFTVAFSADGRTLAAAGGGGRVRLWEVATGKLRGELHGHRDLVYTVAFAPDLRTLASAGADGTVLLWDLPVQFPPRFSPLGNQDVCPVERFWIDLARAEAGRAYRALVTLGSMPRTTPAFLAERLRAAEAVPPPHVAALIADLDNRRYAAREKAMSELEKLGDRVEPFLQQALAANPPLEVQRRLERILARLTQDGPPAEQMRILRAVEALEMLGTAEARQVLQRLAEGAPGARATEQARAALRRLAREGA
jgi:hypothetical protein